MIKRYVMDPRKLERHVIETKQWSFPYQYGEVSDVYGILDTSIIYRTLVRVCAVYLPWAVNLRDSTRVMRNMICRPQKLHGHESLCPPLQELFHVRRKEFWPLTQADKLLHDFIPNQVSHESDGLILQGELAEPLSVCVLGAQRS